MSPEEAQKLKTQQLVLTRIDGRFRVASIFTNEFPMFHLNRLSSATPLIEAPVHHEDLHPINSFTDVADLLLLLVEVVSYQQFTMQNL